MDKEASPWITKDDIRNRNEERLIEKIEKNLSRLKGRRELSRGNVYNVLYKIKIARVYLENLGEENDKAKKAVHDAILEFSKFSVKYLNRNTLEEVIKAYEEMLHENNGAEATLRFLKVLEERLTTLAIPLYKKKA